MNDVPRQTLRRLVARYGTGLCSDARRCEGLLRDLCGAHRREINILVSALKEHVPLDLLAAQSAMPRDLLLARLSRRLEDHLALTEEAARWAVDSWALALGMITDADVKDREERYVRDAPPTPSATATKSVAEGDTERTAPAAEQPIARPAAPPRRQQQGQPPTRAPLPVSPPTSRPSPLPPIASPAGRGTVAGRNPPAVPRSNAPAQTTTAATRPGPPQDPPARKRRGTLRGCAVGCLLLILLSLALFFGAPFVVSVLREEQQQRSVEPPARSP